MRGRKRGLRWAAGLVLFGLLSFPLPATVKTAGAGPISLQKSGTERAPVFWASHGYPAPAEVEFRLIRGASETISQPPMPVRVVVPANARVEAFRLRARQATGAWSYAYDYRFVLGDPQARHAPEGPYRPPVPPGRRFRLAGTGQGEEANAVTILMDPGTPVIAARSGVVVDVRQRPFQRRIGQRAIQGETTSVRLLHSDGTFGVYAHLARDSAALEPGVRVERGRPIGRIGRNFEPPALLFMVQRNAGMNLVSVPFQFEGPDGGAVSPRRGMIVSAR
ncbi:MAG: M23 family metallopeptidase [Thermodesulfobacteriota bacterium]